MKPKITFSNVTKCYQLYSKQSDKLLELLSLKKEKQNHFNAIRNLSFEIFEGEAIGIVGLNGSGKSSICNLLAKIIPPTSGKIEVNGKVSLIAISSGLNSQLTGLENIELKCLMHGLKKEEIRRIQSDIIEFADLGKFIHQPLKNYSSGMKARLGFAISVHTNPDILIIDEALSVGDHTFYQKCMVKINQFKGEGKTIIFISHSLSQVEALCDRVLWMNFGKMEKFDQANIVIAEYMQFTKWFNSLSESEKRDYRKEKLTEQSRIDNVSYLDLELESPKQRSERTWKTYGIYFVMQMLILSLMAIISAATMFG